MRGTAIAQAMMLHTKLAGFLSVSVLTLVGSAHALAATSATHKPTAKSGKHAGQSPFPKTKTKPSPGKPASKTLPVPRQMQPISRGKPQLDPKVANALRKPKVLDKKRIASIANRFAIEARANNVESTTTLSVRRPHRGPGAYMSFESARSVRPQSPSDGLAAIDGGADLRRVHGTGPTPVAAQTPEMLARQYDPLHPEFPPSAEATLEGPHVSVHLQAAANRDYVISCRVRASQSAADFGVRVEVDGSYAHMITSLAPERGRISFALRRAAKVRGIDLQLVAGLPFTAQDGLGIGAAVAGRRRVIPFSISRCDITPLS